MHEVELGRMPDETMAQYAERMIYVVEIIEGFVNMEAGRLIDVGEMLERLRFIADHADDSEWEACWELRQQIDRITSRMVEVEDLARVLATAQRIKDES